MPTCAGRAVAPLASAPGGEVAPVAGVGPPGGQRLLRLGVGHGGVDLGLGQHADGRHCRVEGDQVVQGRVSRVGEGMLSDLYDPLNSNLVNCYPVALQHR